MVQTLANRRVERLLAHAFFFFFVFEIFSPQIGDRTLYLEYLFVLPNPYFWKWLFEIRFSRQVLYLILPAIVMVPFHTVAAIKLVVVFFGVAFLVYCYERNLFKAIKPYLVITVCVALLQFIATVSGNLSVAISIGPSSLAHMVWGSYGTATNTNFYTIFFFPRVSGLAREAGFFASLLVVSYLAFRVNDRTVPGQLSRRFSLVHLVGYVVSFSKGSVALFPALLIMKLRGLVDRIPLFLIGGAFLGVLVLFWHHYRFILIAANSITYLARFGGYAFIYDLNVHQLVFGVSDLTTVQGPFARFLSYASANATGFGRLAGLGGWVVQNGLLAFFLYTLGLQALGVRGAGFLLVLLMTATVGIDTNQNFVLLAYYVAFMLSRLPERSLARRSRSRVAFARPALATY